MHKNFSVTLLACHIGSKVGNEFPASKMQLCNKMQLTRKQIKLIPMTCTLEDTVLETSSINSFTASGDLSSADNLCKQFGPRSGPTKCRA